MDLHLPVIRGQEQGDQVFPALPGGDEGQGQQGGLKEGDFGQVRPLGEIVGPAVRGLGRPQQFGQDPPQLGSVSVDVRGGDGQAVQRQAARWASSTSRAATQCSSWPGSGRATASPTFSRSPRTWRWTTWVRRLTSWSQSSSMGAGVSRPATSTRGGS